MNQRMSMRTDLEVLNSFDLMTRTRDRESQAIGTAPVRQLVKQLDGFLNPVQSLPEGRGERIRRQVESIDVRRLCNIKQSVSR